jgi:hypothetical protein
VPLCRCTYFYAVFTLFQDLNWNFSLSVFDICIARQFLGNISANFESKKSWPGLRPRTICYFMIIILFAAQTCDTRHCPIRTTASLMVRTVVIQL